MTERQRFVADQGLEMLVGDDLDLQLEMDPRNFRGRSDKPVEFGRAEELRGEWVPLASLAAGTSTDEDSERNDDSEESQIGRPTDADVLLDWLSGENSLSDADTPMTQPLRRLCIVAESGFGKTVRLKWLRRAIADRGSRLIPFYLPIDQLPASNDGLLDELASQMQMVPGNEKRVWPEEKAVESLRRWQLSGRILLLLDAMDQIRGLEQLKQTLSLNGFCKNCTIVVSGRPGVIQAQLEIFRDDFEFIRPVEFTQEQLTTYIGQKRADELPNMEDAADILRNPRVAYYLGYVIPFDRLRELQTASEVFEAACTHLLREGLKCDDAWRLGLVSGMDCVKRIPLPDNYDPDNAKQVQRAHRLLSAIAIEQILLPPPPDQRDPDKEEGDAPPNFSGVTHKEWPRFRKRVFERIRQHDPRYLNEVEGEELFQFDLECLSAANVAITRGLLDVRSVERGIRWRNRSLQEYYNGSLAVGTCHRRRS